MSKLNVFYAKCRENAIIPFSKNGKEDGGHDVWAFLPDEVKDKDYIILQPGDTLLLPTGIKSAFENTHVAIFKERGSTGTKGIGQRSGVIDSGYRDEWFVPVTNHNNCLLYLHANSDSFKTFSEDVKDAVHYNLKNAICQVIYVELPTVNAVEITEEELMAIPSKRGTGSKGSTNIA